MHHGQHKPTRHTRDRWCIGLLVGLTVHISLPAALFAEERDAWLGRDKALHFGASAALAMGGYAAAAALSTENTPSSYRLGAGALLALGLGVGKEIADRYTGGHPSWRDMGWNALGTATGLATAWLIDRYLLSLVVSPAHVGK